MANLRTQICSDKNGLYWTSQDLLPLITFIYIKKVNNLIVYLHIALICCFFLGQEINLHHLTQGDCYVAHAFTMHLSVCNLLQPLNIGVSYSVFVLSAL